MEGNPSTPTFTTVNRKVCTEYRTYRHHMQKGTARGFRRETAYKIPRFCFLIRFLDI